jgi:integrase
MLSRRAQIQLDLAWAQAQRKRDAEATLHLLDAERVAPEAIRHTSPLAKRPYDLRHAAVSLWLNAGVPPTQVAEWAGHSVNVLLRVYAKCVYGQDEVARQRIEAALVLTASAEESDVAQLPHVFPANSPRQPG